MKTALILASLLSISAFAQEKETAKLSEIGLKKYSCHLIVSKEVQAKAMFSSSTVGVLAKNAPQAVTLFLNTVSVLFHPETMSTPGSNGEQLPVLDAVCTQS